MGCGSSKSTAQPAAAPPAAKPVDGQITSPGVAGETGEQVPRTQDMEYYTTWVGLNLVLQSKDVVLVKASWMCSLASAGGVLPRRQDIPAEAVWSTEDLFDAEGISRAEVVCVSYCWLKPNHPDPEGKQLRTLGEFLKQYQQDQDFGPGRPKGSQISISDDRDKSVNAPVAVFMDWVSLYQEQRTPEELQAFKRSLAHLNLWYASQKTQKWMLTRLPEGCQGVKGYNERGWPTFEKAVSCLTAHFTSALDLGACAKLGSNWSQTKKACISTREPPGCPKMFLEELKTKTFTNGADLELVSKKYCETFNVVMSSTEMLGFRDLKWNFVEAERLATALPYCLQLKMLHLGNNNLGDRGIITLSAAVVQCPSLEFVALDQNNIGNDGAIALANALPRIGKLAGICLGHAWFGTMKFGNNIGDAGAKSLVEQACSCTSIVYLGLEFNKPVTQACATDLQAMWAKADKPVILDKPSPHDCRGLWF